MLVAKRNEGDSMAHERWELGDGENRRRDGWSARLIGTFKTRNCNYFVL
jgi:hypothetical protein